MTSMNLEAARVIAESSLDKARDLGLPPMSVGVLDPRGVALVVLTQEAASLMRPDIAQAKAWAALAMGRSSGQLAELAQVHPALVDGFLSVSGGRMIPAAGGLLVAAADASVIGAVGVSGARPDQDEACARAGMAAAGFTEAA